MSDLDSEVKNLRDRLDALQRGDLPPKLAGSTLADAYEQDNLVEEQIPGVVVMKPVVVACESVAETSELSTSDNTATEMVADTEVPLGPLPEIQAEVDPIIDLGEVVHERQDVVETNSDQEEPPHEDQHVAECNRAETGPGEPSAEKTRAKPSKTRLLAVAILIVVGGLVVFSKLGASHDAGKDVVGASSVIAEPPSVAPPLGQSVQGRTSSATTPVQARVSSASGKSRKTKIAVMAAPVAAAMASVNKKSSAPVEAKPVKSESASEEIALKNYKPTRGSRIEAVLPYKLRHLRNHKKTETVAEKATKDDASKAPAKVAESSNNIIESLEKAKSLN